MRKNIVAGNWKMNKNLQEGIALAKELNEALAADKPNCDVVICTPFIPLPFFSYGGSSLWGFTFLLFIFLRIDANREMSRR